MLFISLSEYNMHSWIYRYKSFYARLFINVFYLDVKRGAVCIGGGDRVVHIFVINTKAGKGGFSTQLRNHLAKRDDIKYYIMHTRGVRGEIELIKDVFSLFEGERIRIYSCGGSGTLCNILNGIPNFENVEVACFPKGLTNDFLKNFGADRNRFGNIDELIDGDVVNIDYIKTNHGVCLNTFSIGLDSILVKKVEEYRATSVFGRRTPYTLGFLYSVFLSKSEEYIIKADDVEIEGVFPQVFFGNGGTIGGSLCFEEHSKINDGMGLFAFFLDKGIFARILVFGRLVRKKKQNDSKYTDFRYAQKIELRRKDNTPICMDFDGELQAAETVWTAEIVKEGLQFVVPKGVKV